MKEFVEKYGELKAYLVEFAVWNQLDHLFTKICDDSTADVEDWEQSEFAQEFQDMILELTYDKGEGSFYHLAKLWKINYEEDDDNEFINNDDFYEDIVEYADEIMTDMYHLQVS